MTQEKICVELGFVDKNGKPRISRWGNYETGGSQPNLKEFVNISKYFGISETDLLHTDLSQIANEQEEKYSNSYKNVKKDLNLSQQKDLNWASELVKELRLDKTYLLEQIKDYQSLLRDYISDLKSKANTG